VRLADLLDEGVDRAAAAIAERAAEGQSRDGVAVAVGIGAVKYSDLATERIRDYVFDWDRMLAFEGNTGPYLQYAHARIASIFRRSEIPAPGPGTPVTLDEHAERALGLALLGFNEAVAETLATWSPSKLCTYLFDLATTFTTFYENCPVLKAPDESTRNSRLVLSDVTARVLVRGLGLLGIEAPDQM
jgi:arginyl-tRNA synthetase